MQNKLLNQSGSIVLLLLFVFSIGCGESYQADYSQLGLVPVTGEVKLDGDPLPAAVVFFVQADGTKSYATTDEDGCYRMKFNSQVDGVLPGDVVVEVSTIASTGEININANYADADPDAPKPNKKKELVPSQYNKESKLQVTVSPSQREFNFDLKSDGSTTGPS